MARTRVRQETINKIASMGMANALKHANDNDDPEFREAVKRYYPKAKYGPKTAAAASKPTVTPASTATPRADSKSVNTDARNVLGQHKSSPVVKAVARRVEPAKKSMRGVDQKKAVLPGPKGWKTWPWDKDKPNKPERKMWPGDKPKKKGPKKIVGYARNGQPRYK